MVAFVLKHRHLQNAPDFFFLLNFYDFDSYLVYPTLILTFGVCVSQL